MSELPNSQEASHQTAIAERLRERKEEILALWARRAREVLPASSQQDELALYDHLPEFLDELADLLAGEARGSRTRRVERSHARQRAALPDYTLDQVLREYALLRDTVADVLDRDDYLTGRDHRVLVHAIDEAQVEAARQYSSEVRAHEREAEQHLLLALAAGRTALWNLDLQSGALTTTDNFDQLFGVKRSGRDWRYEHFLERVHPDDRAALDEAIAAVREGRTPEYRREFRIVCPTGEIRWLFGMGRRFDGAEQLSGTVTDITDRKHAELQLRDVAAGLERRVTERTEFLNAVLESLDDGIVACDTDGVLTVFNRASRDFHGLPVSAITPDRWAQEYDLYLPDGKTRMRKDEIPLYRALRGETVRDAEMVIAPRGLPIRRTSCSGRAVYDAEGNKIGAVVAMHDVSPAHEAEDERIKRAAAEAAQARVTDILESITDAFFSVDRDWRITYVNRPASRVTGRPADELLGNNLWDEFPAATQTAILPELTRAMNERVHVHFEAFYPAPINAWLELNAYPTANGLSVYYRDVTERVRVKEQLAQLHERERGLRLEAERRAAELDAIIDSMPDQIFIGNTETFLRVNQPALDVMGFDSLEDMIGGDIRKFPERAQLRDAHTGAPLKLEDTPFAHARQGERVVRELTHVNPKTGEKRTFVAKATPVRVDGVIRGVVAVHIDITEHMRATRRVAALHRITRAGLAQLSSTRELVESFSALLKETYESELSVVLLLNAQGELMIEAENGRATNGPTPTRLPRFAHRVLGSRQPVCLEDAAELPEFAQEAAARGVRTIAGAALRFGEEVLGIVLVGYRQPRSLGADDLTLLAAAADQIAMSIRHAKLYAYSQEQVKNLRAERQMREQFVFALTHDLRGPLTSAQMSASLVLRRPDAVDDHSRWAHRILDSIGRADAMIRDLLDANRIRAGQALPLEMVPCDLAQLARSTCEEFGSVHGRRCLIDAADEARGYWSCEGLRRVLENLLSNGAKYGHPTEPLRITVRTLGDEVELEVNNALKGAPLSAAEQAQLFIPFVRTASADASGKVGWGLGLALVKGLVESHGGTIRVESTVERGTSFIARLPRDARPHQRVPPSEKS